MTTESKTEAQPWWKFGHVWMVLAGPAIVVVASFVTLYLAHNGLDPVVDEDYYRKGVELNKNMKNEPTGLEPAVQARNHIGTGGQVPAKK